MSAVSVVVPIYNAEKKLDKCIKSILNQTFKDFELILVNDGSNDDSLKICQRYCEQDNRIILISKQNEGSIATRNKGIKISKSEYVMFVDADDWIDKTAIEILYNTTIKSDVDITVCNTYKVLGNSQLIKQKNTSWFFKLDKVYDGEEIKNELATAYLHGHPFPASLHGKLYRREILEKSGKYLNRIHFLGDDLFYNLEMFLIAKKVKVIDKPLYYYRQGGFTSKYMPYLFDDTISGYQIQKEVVEEHFHDSREKQSYGICIMLLNSFKTCLVNLFNSQLSDVEMKAQIEKYVSDNNLIESTFNNGSISFFPKVYLHAIRNRDIEFLYDLGLRQYNKTKPRRYLYNILSRIS
ncbi:hypothetical protein BC351_00360 [Paenibacillus ferrarius]|uniref:Glycosyltransferase 2-like domain-containing protein n=1 Tax=Paenibacillus ferrarius TaxID=1469647 RepID=A0A1V4HSH0_9BACL|nr:glycosyltransferase family 2 protein [Paenibacillus ferrarius]OPH61728.1 hypothetical protein BC351_00360 [Paenibacillus ferrarius]